MKDNKKQGIDVYKLKVNPELKKVSDKKQEANLKAINDKYQSAYERLTKRQKGKRTSKIDYQDINTKHRYQLLQTPSATRKDFNARIKHYQKLGFKKEATNLKNRLKTFEKGIQKYKETKNYKYLTHPQKIDFNLGDILGGTTNIEAHASNVFRVNVIPKNIRSNSQLLRIAKKHRQSIQSANSIERQFFDKILDGMETRSKNEKDTWKNAESADKFIRVINSDRDWYYDNIVEFEKLARAFGLSGDLERLLKWKF